MQLNSIKIPSIEDHKSYDIGDQGELAHDVFKGFITVAGYPHQVLTSGKKALSYYYAYQQDGPVLCALQGHSPGHALIAYNLLASPGEAGAPIQMNEDDQ